MELFNVRHSFNNIVPGCVGCKYPTFHFVSNQREVLRTGKHEQIQYLCQKTHGQNRKIKECCILESLTLWLISHLLSLSSKLHIRHITKDHTLNVALDITKKHRIGKLDWKKNQTIISDSQVTTLHVVTVSGMTNGGRELLFTNHPPCSGCCLCQKLYLIPIKSVEWWSQKDPDSQSSSALF